MLCYGAHTLSISCTKSVISCKASIIFSHARIQGGSFSPYCDSFWHKLSQYGKKILYTYVYHIVYYLRKSEALHEITDFVHEMLSVCAPYNNTSVSATNETRMPGHNDTRFKLYDTLLSKLCNTQSKLYDTLWNQTLWHMTLHDTPLWHLKLYDTPLWHLTLYDTWHSMTHEP